MITVSDKIDNIDLVVSDVELCPQTYGTILKEEIYNITFQFKLRRKINIALKAGKLCKTVIPGTRGQAILFSNNKKYKIIVEATRVGVNVYYFFDFSKQGKFYIKLSHYWILADSVWNEVIQEKLLFEGSILKFI